MKKNIVVCVSLCLSQIGVLSKRMDELIKLGFGTGAFFHPSYTVL